MGRGQFLAATRFGRWGEGSPDGSWAASRCGADPTSPTSAAADSLGFVGWGIVRGDRGVHPFSTVNADAPFVALKTDSRPDALFARYQGRRRSLPPRFEGGVRV